MASKWSWDVHTLLVIVQNGPAFWGGQLSRCTKLQFTCAQGHREGSQSRNHKKFLFTGKNVILTLFFFLSFFPPSLLIKEARSEVHWDSSFHLSEWRKSPLRNRLSWWGYREIGADPWYLQEGKIGSCREHTVSICQKSQAHIPLTKHFHFREFFLQIKFTHMQTIHIKYDKGIQCSSKRLAGWLRHIPGSQSLSLLLCQIGS